IRQQQSERSGLCQEFPQEGKILGLDALELGQHLPLSELTHRGVVGALVFGEALRSEQAAPSGGLKEKRPSRSSSLSRSIVGHRSSLAWPHHARPVGAADE